MDTVGLLSDDIVVLYLVGIDWVVNNVDKGRSNSQIGGTLAGDILFCRSLGCCTVEIDGVKFHAIEVNLFKSSEVTTPQPP